jgi:hypothetical protein
VKETTVPERKPDRKSQPKREPSFGVDGEIIQYIAFQTLARQNASSITKRLEVAATLGEKIEYGFGKEKRVLDMRGKTAPLYHTVGRIARTVKPPDLSGRWSLGSTCGDVTWDPSDAGRVAHAVASVMEDTWGQMRSVTEGQARRIAWVFNVAPDIVPWLAYALGVDYDRRTRDDEPTTDLDAILAFAPWRTDERGRHPMAGAYAQAVGEGWVLALPRTSVTSLFAGGAPFLDRDDDEQPETFVIPDQPTGGAGGEE